MILYVLVKTAFSDKKFSIEEITFTQIFFQKFRNL